MMDTRPVAEQGPARPASKLAPPQAIPILQMPRMVVWLRPAYPLEWARTELEGTVRLSFLIRQTGDTSKISIERSSGSHKLDVSAAEAAKSWKFVPERWQGQPVESKATLELTFRFFEFSVSRIADEAIATDSEKTGGRTTVHLDGSETLRRVVEQLRAGSTNVFVTSGRADAEPAWPASMRNWAPISGIQYLGAMGRPEWRRYTVKLKNRAAEPIDSVVVRWELYRVTHDEHAALWEIALDRTGTVWALKAQSLEAFGHANRFAGVCSGAKLTPD